MKARLLTLSGIILLAALSRLLPHPPNFTPVMAIALFGGAYFQDKRAAFFVPIVAMLVSDLFLGFHVTMWGVYASFLATVVIGFWIQRQRSFSRIVAGGLAASILFFLVTNAAAWLAMEIYPKTAEGLMAAYVAAIPFFQNTLLGNAFYLVTLFGGYALLERALPQRCAVKV